MATFAYNTFNTLNLANFSPYELVFGRNPKMLLNLETTPDVKVAGTFRHCHDLLHKRWEYLNTLLQEFNLKRLGMIKIELSFSITTET